MYNDTVNMIQNRLKREFPDEKPATKKDILVMVTYYNAQCGEGDFAKIEATKLYQNKVKQCQRVFDFLNEPLPMLF